VALGDALEEMDFSSRANDGHEKKAVGDGSEIVPRTQVHTRPAELWSNLRHWGRSAIGFFFNFARYLYSYF
jgi:hypothetical protein